MSRLADWVLARGLVPDSVLRRIVRGRVKGLVEGLDGLRPETQETRSRALAARLAQGPVTIRPEEANRQHYELPPQFFREVLGPRLKYSSCYWPAGVVDLAGAEEAMLRVTAERADLRDGQDVLDLGCGWGSLTIWVAERFPRSKILAISNSSSQRDFIADLCAHKGLANVEVTRAEVGGFSPDRCFDRVVSVEMLEHVRNHSELLGRVSTWLKPEGRLFVHVFCHRRHLYAFESGGTGGWMADHFFSGGVMPSWDYLPGCTSSLELLERWQVDGRHYAKTLRAWLENLDHRKTAVIPWLEAVYGADDAALWLAYWRLFFMACEETFALREGTEYFVAHYLFGRRYGGADVQARR